MSIAALLHQKITVFEAGSSTNRAGDAVMDWSDPEKVTVVQGWIQPRRSSESTDLRNREGVRAKGYFLPEAPINAGSRVRDPQRRVWQVIGPPLLVTAPGRNSHVQVELQWLEG